MSLSMSVSICFVGVDAVSGPGHGRPWCHLFLFLFVRSCVRALVCVRFKYLVS